MLCRYLSAFIRVHQSFNINLLLVSYFNLFCSPVLCPPGISQSYISQWLLQQGLEMSDSKRRAFYRWYLLERNSPGVSHLYLFHTNNQGWIFDQGSTPLSIQSKPVNMDYSQVVPIQISPVPHPKIDAYIINSGDFNFLHSASSDDDDADMSRGRATQELGLCLQLNKNVKVCWVQMWCR